jgi:hypothetical protein
MARASRLLLDVTLLAGSLSEQITVTSRAAHAAAYHVDAGAAIDATQVLVSSALPLLLAGLAASMPLWHLALTTAPGTRSRPG